MNPWALLFPGNCELQQKLFPWLERVYGLSPLRILRHLITSEVTHLPFPRSGCSQGFLPLPGVRSGSSWSARSVTRLTGEKLKVTGQVTAAWYWQEDRASDGQLLFCMEREKRGETFRGQQVKVFASGPRAALQKGTAQGGAAATNSVLFGCRFSHDSCRIRGLCWALFFFFPREQLDTR